MNVQLTFVFKFFDLSSSPLSSSKSLTTETKSVSHPGRSSVATPFTMMRKQRTLYTLLRSPHIDKKSREQFEKLVYQQLVRLTLPLSKARAFFMANPSAAISSPASTQTSFACTSTEPTYYKSKADNDPLSSAPTSLSDLHLKIAVKIRINYKTYEN